MLNNPRQRKIAVASSLANELNRLVAERFHSSDFSRTGNDEAVVLCRWVNEPVAISDECLIVDFVADVPLS